MGPSRRELLAEIRRLKRRVADAELEIEFLRNGGIKGPQSLMMAFGLSRTQAVMLDMLASCPIVSASDFAARLWGQYPREVASIRVMICNLRRRITPFGLRIQNIHSAGYWMSEPDRVLVREIDAPSQRAVGELHSADHEPCHHGQEREAKAAAE